MVLVGIACVVFALFVAAPAARAADSAGKSAKQTLSAADAIVLGVVEGVTEYLPISSTGHLLVAARILDLPSKGDAGDAIKSYEIAIQFGAILAVLVLVSAPTADDGRGALRPQRARPPNAQGGRDRVRARRDRRRGQREGDQGSALRRLAGHGRVDRRRHRGDLAESRGKLPVSGGRALDSITTRDAMIVGAAQVLALWPGTSRSLVTIVAALLIGISMGAAVEFSFLLGFVTLTAATGYEMLSSGKTMIDNLGIAIPLLGLVVAFVAAIVSIRWMVSYLSRHDLSIFGWYRIGVALIVLGLLASHTI